ncbi:MAG TPA: hypothetical protein DCS97_11405 [Planctomycetes bacterium]|nr:hypothetical protein [Planctomycetota bacterium]
MNSTCFDCGATLNQKSQAIWACSNAGCPGGTEKHLCGYCKSSSFSPTTGICANQACRTHKIARRMCPSCQYQSVLTLGGMTFCLNRLCPTHAACVVACPTCANDSLIQLDGVAVCVKSTCASLLYLVPWPATIGSRRGLGGNPLPTGSGIGRAAPVTTALRRPATPGVGPGGAPRYLADPDATTVIRPAGSGYAVDADAGTVIQEAPAAAPKGIDDMAITVAQPPLSLADSVAETVLDSPPKPKKFPAVVDDKAETVLLPPKPKVYPPGFDENAETVLQQPPKPMVYPPGFDENAETVLQPPPKV